MRFTVDGDTYEVGAGEAGYHPANSLHSTEAIEDTIAVSVKDIIAPSMKRRRRFSAP